MKYLLFTVTTAIIFVSNSFGAFDHVITEPHFDPIDIVDKSILIKAKAKRVTANGTSHVEVSLVNPSGGYDISDITLNDNSSMNLNSGCLSIFRAYDNSFIRMNGGRLTDSSIKNNSTIHISGGNAGSLFISDNVTVRQSGGYIPYLSMVDNMKAVLSGGTLCTLASYQNVTDSKNITLICDVDSVNYFNGYLSGNWLDGSAFYIQVRSFKGYTPTIDNINIIPEPLTLALMGFGGLLLRRRKQLILKALS